MKNTRHKNTRQRCFSSCFVVIGSFPDDFFFCSESILAISRQLKDIKSPFPDKQQVSERSSRVSVWKHGRLRTADYKCNEPIRAQIPAVYNKVVLQPLGFLSLVKDFSLSSENQFNSKPSKTFNSCVTLV